MTDTIDMTRLPPPAIIATPDFEVVQQQLLSEFLALMDATAPGHTLREVLALESEPVTILLQTVAYREVLVRAAANDQARGCLLALAWGTTLDHLVALLGVVRLVVSSGDPDASPPVAPTYETDDALRVRARLAAEGTAYAAPADYYVSRALGADGRVRAAALVSPEPAEVDVYVLSHVGDGTASADLLAVVDTELQARRTFTDLVRVHGATIVPYAIRAEVTLLPGPDGADVVAAIEAAVDEFRESRHGLGLDIILSALTARLHPAGVYAARLVEPVADIVLDAHQAAWCPPTAVEISVVGRNV